MVTDAGVCWAINSEDMRNIYKSSKSIDTFLDNMGYGIDDTMKNKVENIPGSGDSHIFRLNLAMRGPK